MKSHGTGQFDEANFGKLGNGVVIEAGVLVFHPENIEIGNDVYIGHYSILKGYYKNRLSIGDGTWIGQQCFFHSAGGIMIGHNVGIGPAVKIITSSHRLDELNKPILKAEIDFLEVVIEDDSDLGIGSIVLPGVRIGRGAQVAAGAVVAADVPDFAVVGGVPSKLIRMRK